MKGIASMAVELTTLLVGGTLLFPRSTSFLIYPRNPSFAQRTLSSPLSRLVVSRSFSTTRTRLRPLLVNFHSDDPFQILGMDEPSTDKKVIKRAYKRMALQYHPDVATTKDSSPEEKKRASDRFAKINWAYDVLTGKRENDSTYATGSSKNSGSSSSSSSSSWAPPHRRSGSPSSTASSSNRNADTVDWTDFMPKVDNEEYNVDGDSFGKILSDLFVGAAAGSAGLGGPNVFRDFIEFLEGNVDGFRGGSDDDAELRVILQTGSLDEVRNELDDTELVVQQLNAKLSGIQGEIVTLTTKAKMTTRYLEKMELEESLAELNARKGVVEGYVKRAQKRLLSLQTKYKELLTTGGTSETYAARSGSSWQDIKKEATTTSNTPNGSKSSTTSSSFTSEPPSQRPASNENDAWMNESFGSSSYARGRGEGRRRSRTRSTSSSPSTSSSEPDATTSSPRGQTPRSQESPRYSSSAQYTTSSQDKASTTSSSSALRDVETNIPPHRRTTGSYENQQEKDKRRLRELKVDEEFDKLKKDLGL